MPDGGTPVAVHRHHGVGNLSGMTGDIMTADTVLETEDPPAHRPGSEQRWRSSATDMVAVIGSAVRLLWRHWPVLVSLSFAGMAARGAVTFAAVHVSAYNSVLGLLIFVLVPLVTLIALTLMLRVLRESLPSLRGEDAPKRALDTIGSVLVPFLAVYAAYGYLQDDKSAYYYATWDADQLSSARLPTRLTALAIVVIGVAFLGRMLLDRSAWARDRAWLSIIRAYLEIVWIAVLVTAIDPIQEAVRSWLNDRRVVHGTFTHLDQWGAAGHQVHGALDWIGGLLGSVDTVIAAPVAWLTVGAVVYGREIALRSGIRDRNLVRALTRRWVRLPGLVRRAAMSARDGLDERFGSLIDGLRVVFRAGLLPMLLFCIAFVLVQSTSAWLLMLERWLIGPHPRNTFWVPVGEPLGVLNDAIMWVFLICLLASTIDRVLQALAVPARDVPAASVAVPAQRRPDEEPVLSAE